MLFSGRGILLSALCHFKYFPKACAQRLSEIVLTGEDTRKESYDSLVPQCAIAGIKWSYALLFLCSRLSALER